MAAVEDPLLDCLATHCVVPAAWDDQADVEDPEEDLTCSRPEVLEVLDIFFRAFFRLLLQATYIPAAPGCA